MKKAVKKRAAKKTLERRGPKPEMLKLDGDWGAAIKKTFAKKKPITGWPKENV